MGIMIAGVSSGAGKTTLTIGLMRALSNRGVRVAAFKSGPDYIDPMFHRLATNEPSYNLPSWMVPDEAIKFLYRKRSQDCEISVIEGVMGYYDGHSTESIIGSSAHLALTLEVPVIIVMDGSSMALTAAAIVKGLASFSTPSMIKGVIFNRIKSEYHYNLLKSAVELHTDVKCYGYLKPDDSVMLESRHLGLVQATEDTEIESKIQKMAQLVEDTIDVHAILSDFSNEVHTQSDYQIENEALYQNKITEIGTQISKNGGLTLGVAKDMAFSFYYDENLKLLEEIGVNLVPFSPLYDKALPEGIDAILLGGGYPEVFASTLESNVTMKESIYNFSLSGRAIYAECGGLMYLTDQLIQDENTYKMTGIIGGSAFMTPTLQNFGHVEARFEDVDNFKKGVVIRGHEFHHSYIEMDQKVKRIITVKGKKNERKCGYVKANAIGTYVHTHYYSNLEFLDELIKFFCSNKKIC